MTTNALPMDKQQADEQRRRNAAERGYDVMYAETAWNGYATWTYSDGVKVPMRTFATLQGLQSYAQRKRFAIIYVA